ncbi:hypothetical protein [Roseomonas sp. WA12]
MRIGQHLAALLGLSTGQVEAERIARARERSEAALRTGLADFATPEGPRARLSHGRRDLVMGLALNYGPAELAPFLGSLRATGYGGDVWLLTGAVPPDTRDFLAGHAVRALPFTAIHTMAMSMNSSRMYRYLDALAEAALNLSDDELPGRVLLTDTRDVVFQADPFAALGTSRLRFHLEEPPNLAGSPINSDWLVRALGPEVVAEIGHHPVSCAGTLLGTAEAVFEYLCIMGRMLADVPPEHRHSGVDQAVHNAILWRGLVAGAESVPNGQDVLTIPAGGLGSLAVRDGHRLRDADGRLIAVVHQYDRDPGLAAAIAAHHAAA